MVFVYQSLNCSFGHQDDTKRNFDLFVFYYRGKGDFQSVGRDQ